MFGWVGCVVYHAFFYVYYFGTGYLAVIGIKWTARGLPICYKSDTHLRSNYTAILINLPKCSYTKISLTSISLYIFHPSIPLIMNKWTTFGKLIHSSNINKVSFFFFYVCVIRGGAGAHLGFICCWRCGAPLLDLLWDKTLISSVWVNAPLAQNERSHVFSRCTNNSYILGVP